ncbi:hypothetical protein ACVGVM_02720 [Pseudonocardia bannensis]|uniref:Lytic transglycosylase domain-containing protein n=1 Tax=Pseudonocardia bannensis TaxID=630973 RepID=A0A848DL67_9PSEU|nr:hypothetical protein [Pseudonocardia bannensis]NMH93305.1 lytic transglycosylase domain-containing protein [Pseudonocardia bannensis]
MRATTVLRGPLAAALAALLGLLLLGAASEDPAGSVSGIDQARLPSPAREALPLISELTATNCPELPPLWVLAQVQAESGWDPTATSGDGDGAAAGLYQLSERNWLAAGGARWPSSPPGPDAQVTDAAAHLRVAIPWICANLRAVTGHLAATGKTTDPLDAMLVCHIAGCRRVIESATGVPREGEAGCGARCADLVRRYLDGVHGYLERFAAPVGPAEPAPDPGAPVDPYPGGSTGCTAPDPTGDGCLTGAARYGFETAAAVFGGWRDGPVIRSAGCWDEHAWNPRSDHPRGRACDLFPTEPGVFPEGEELANGWRLTEWFRGNAGPLRVKYLIWQGRYWDPSVSDQGGWGRRYTGGGVYDVRDATGGHYDHLHVSFAE